MAQPDYGYNPSAGWVPPPGNTVDPNYSPYGNIYNNNSQRPKHHGYDAQGQPIPPGFEPPGQQQQGYSPPPREDQYGADPYGQPPPGRSEYDRGYYEGPPTDYGYPGGHGSARGYEDRDRQYAPEEPHPHDGNAITPFDDEKYEAEVRDEQARRYAAQHPPPPPPSDSYFERERGGGRRGGHGDDRRYDSRDRYSDRYSEDSYYDPRDRRDRRHEDDRDRDRDNRDRKHDDRRRDSRQKNEPRSPTKKAQDLFDGREAQVLGGAAGGFLGNQFGGGILETLGGVVVGAVGAKALEKQKMKRDGKKLSGEPPSRREREGVRKELVREGYDGRDYRREDEKRGGGGRSRSRGDPRDDRRGGGGGRSRSRGARPRDDDSYYSDEYSRSPPRR